MRFYMPVARTYASFRVRDSKVLYFGPFAATRTTYIREGAPPRPPYLPLSPSAECASVFRCAPLWMDRQLRLFLRGVKHLELRVSEEEMELCTVMVEGLVI